MVLSACANKSSDEEAQQATTNSPMVASGGTNTNTNSNTNTNTNTNTDTDTDTDTDTTTTGCGPNAGRQFYEGNTSGTGAYKNSTGRSAGVSFGGTSIQADQVLRVSVEPSGSGANTSSGGSQSYAKMALQVRLLKRNSNGTSTVIATKYIGNDVDASGFKTGIPVGQKTATSKLDFSSYLVSGAAGYTIAVNEIQNDWTCKTSAAPTSQNFVGHCFAASDYYAWNCVYYQSYGSQWTQDYVSGNYYCCDGPQLHQSQLNVCGVTYAGDTSSWSVIVRVETDHTTCIN